MTHSFKDLPYHVILRITREYYSFEIDDFSEFGILDFFGKFSLDCTRTVFCFFVGFTILGEYNEKCQQFLPVETEYIRFVEVQVLDSMISTNFKNLKELIGVSSHPRLKYGGIEFLPKSIKKLSIELETLNEGIIECINTSLAELEYLSVKVTNLEDDINIEFDLPKLKKLIFDSRILPENFSFSKLPVIEVLRLPLTTISTKQMESIFKITKLRRFHSFGSHLPSNSHILFEKREIEIIDLKYTFFEACSLKYVVIPENSFLRKIDLEGSNISADVRQLLQNMRTKNKKDIIDSNKES